MLEDDSLQIHLCEPFNGSCGYNMVHRFVIHACESTDVWLPRKMT